MEGKAFAGVTGLVYRSSVNLGDGTAFLTPSMAPSQCLANATTFIHSEMKSEVTEPVIQGTSTNTHQTGSHSAQPLRAQSWSPPQEGEKKKQLPRGLFHAEVAYWLLCPGEPAPCINAQIDG